jgi:hypothetical protein
MTEKQTLFDCHTVLTSEIHDTQVDWQEDYP